MKNTLIEVSKVNRNSRIPLYLQQEELNEQLKYEQAQQRAKERHKREIQMAREWKFPKASFKEIKVESEPQILNQKAFPSIPMALSYGMTGSVSGSIQPDLLPEVFEIGRRRPIFFHF